MFDVKVLPDEVVRTASAFETADVGVRTVMDAE